MRGTDAGCGGEAGRRRGGARRSGQRRCIGTGYPPTRVLCRVRWGMVLQELVQRCAARLSRDPGDPLSPYTLPTPSPLLTYRTCYTALCTDTTNCNTLLFVACDVRHFVVLRSGMFVPERVGLRVGSDAVLEGRGRTLGLFPPMHTPHTPPLLSYAPVHTRSLSPYAHPARVPATLIHTCAHSVSFPTCTPCTRPAIHLRTRRSSLRSHCTHASLLSYAHTHIRTLVPLAYAHRAPPPPATLIPALGPSSPTLTVHTHVPYDGTPSGALGIEDGAVVTAVAKEAGHVPLYRHTRPLGDARY
eukprot:3933794-Rhodomonas_salina.1